MKQHKCAAAKRVERDDTRPANDPRFVPSIETEILCMLEEEYYDEKKGEWIARERWRAHINGDEYQMRIAFCPFCGQKLQDL
jgi:hypothetical protein